MGKAFVRDNDIKGLIISATVDLKCNTKSAARFSELFYLVILKGVIGVKKVHHGGFT